MRYSRLGLSVDADLLKKEDIPSTTTTATTTNVVNNNNVPLTTTTTTATSSTEPPKPQGPPVTTTTTTTNAEAPSGLSDGEETISKSSFQVHGVGPSKSDHLPTSGVIFKLNIHIVDNWKLRVPISEQATIQQLMVNTIIPRIE